MKQNCNIIIKDVCVIDKKKTRREMRDMATLIMCLINLPK